MIKCGLNIGHGRSFNGKTVTIDPGAISTTFKLSEFELNSAVAKLVSEAKFDGVEVVLVFQNSWEQLAAQLNALKPDFIISMHCNASAKPNEASGCEALIYKDINTGAISIKGHDMATIAIQEFEKMFGPSARSQKIKPITVNERGGGQLYHTNAPCIICEPFFINNARETQLAHENKSAFAACYCNIIQRIANSFSIINI